MTRGLLTPCAVEACIARAHRATNNHRGLSDVQRRSGHAALDTVARELAAELFRPRFEGDTSGLSCHRQFILDARGGRRRLTAVAGSSQDPAHERE